MVKKMSDAQRELVRDRFRSFVDAATDLLDLDQATLFRAVEDCMWFDRSLELFWSKHRSRC